MIAFHGKQEVKDLYLARLKAHHAADEIVKGQYWENGRGCAVGCTLHSDEHKAYETELGLPEWLAFLEDRIFEGVPEAEAPSFAVAFLESIPVGAVIDDRIKHAFSGRMLRRTLERVKTLKCEEAIRDRVIGVIEQVISLCDSHSNDTAAWAAAWDAARAAASAAARDAAWAAAWAAASAAAWAAAWAAASAAARDAASATAWAAAWAASDAAWAASDADWAASDAAWAAEYSAQAKDLLELLATATN